MARQRNKGYKLKRDPETLTIDQLRIVKAKLNERVIFHLKRNELDLYFESITLVNRINYTLKEKEKGNVQISKVNEKK